MHSPVTIELSEKALRANFRYLRKQIGTEPRISCVVKGNAYGHGIGSFVPLAEKIGVDHFSVFSALEARQVLSSSNGSSEIMIMGYIDNEDLGWALSNNISFWVFELDRLEAAVSSARHTGKQARIHLELETGMNRTGFDMDELVRVLEIIRRNAAEVSVEGVCTHFSGAESIGNYLRIQNQIKKFRDMCTWLKNSGVEYGIRHTACSASALTYPETIMDMVRFGIALYGFWPSRETRIRHLLGTDGKSTVHQRDPLRRILRMKSKVMSTKIVAPGEFVGYGNSYQTAKRERLAAVPVGYSTGFARSLSNLGHVLIRGRRCKVTGIVNMSMIMVDVSHLGDVQKGEEVVIIGRNGNSCITVASFSDITTNLNYELLVRLPSEIPRMIVE